MGQAIGRYQMIEDGDRIVVGLSGGKDSLTMLWLLNERLARVPIDYSLFPVYIDPGFKPGFADELRIYLKTDGHDLIVDHTDFGLVAHSDINRENPCFLCSRRRRQRLFEIADELDCRKVALGHNQDDLIETLFINICYAGEIATMMPRQSSQPLATSASSAPKQYARGAIEAAAALVADPNHASWVRDHWGDTYLEKENKHLQEIIDLLKASKT